MDKQTNFNLRKKVVKQPYCKPTLFKKTLDGFTLTTDPPVTNLKPDDFEIGNLISAGANLDKGVNYEKPISVDKLDEVDSAVANYVDSEKFNQKKESEK